MYVHHGVVKYCPWDLEEAPSNLVVLTRRPSAPLAAQKLTQRSASSPLSSLETHFIAPPSYKTTSKYSKILRVHAVMGRQRQLIKRRSRGDVERAAAAHGQAQRPDLYTARFLVLWNSSSRLLAALFRAHLVSQQCIVTQNSILT